jgi:hypothetical protein
MIKWLGTLRNMMNLQTNQFNLYEIVNDELTNKSVQSLLLREMTLQTDQVNLYGGMKDELINRSTLSLLI